MADKTPMTARQKRIVNRYMAKAAVAGVPGSLAMHADMWALVPMWGVMIFELGRESGWKLSKEDALKVATAVSTTGMSVLVALRLGGVLFKFTPPGFLLTMFANSAANAACTFVIGQKVAETFSTVNFDERMAMEKIIKSASWTIVHIPGVSGDITQVIEHGKHALGVGQGVIDFGSDVIDQVLPKFLDAPLDLKVVPKIATV